MQAETEGNQKQKDIITPKLQLVAWELTRSCNLLCAHCRASANGNVGEGELTTKECYRVIDEIKMVASPIIIMTGGEPLMRPDFFEIASYAAQKGLRVVVGSNGTVLTPDVTRRLKEVPVARVSVSLDFPNAAEQDKFRGRAGAFQKAVDGIRNLKDASIEVQVNSTITKLNVHHLSDLLNMAKEAGAVSFHPFMLVPTGRGKNLKSVVLSSEEHEATLNWFYDKQLEMGGHMFCRPVDAPHYFRISRQRQKQGDPKPVVASNHGGHPIDALTRGCLAGTGFCFISHKGRVQGCGYLDVSAGNVREQSFGNIWYNSPLFNDLRDLSLVKGKCGACEYKRICGGCRARAYEATGDYLKEEPYCIYQPSLAHAKQKITTV